MGDGTGIDTRACAGCGGRLSRYNDGDTCTACAGARARPIPAPASGEPIALPGEAGDGAGQVLRAWRAAHRRSQAEVAAALGMTQQALSQLENGRRPLSIDQRRLIVAELGIAPEDLGLAAAAPRARVDEEGDQGVAASRLAWREQRRWLNQHRSELARLAVSLYPDSSRIARSPVITCDSWRLDGPAELGEFRLDLDEGPQTVQLRGAEPESATVRPLRTAETRFDSYTAAVRHLDPPRLFESRPSYRLLGGDLGERQMRFGMAAYFDKLDISETLGHELAAACMDDGIPPSPAGVAGRLPFRDLLSDPFDAGRRAIIPAITTLTIRLRRHPQPSSFLLHWRDPASVATAAGVYDVVPAGEFQPSSVALWDRQADFTLWRNMVREYSEELLGTPEHDGTRTEPIDYDNWRLYRRLTDARAAGTAHAAVLGMGLDALTLAATILTVVVLDDEVFDASFGEAVRYNDEGEIVAVAGGKPTDGIPFTGESVRRMLEVEPLASPGAACLSLAWAHRGELLGL